MVNDSVLFEKVSSSRSRVYRYSPLGGSLVMLAVRFGAINGLINYD